jgi:hypothetical protein
MKVGDVSWVGDDMNDKIKQINMYPGHELTIYSDANFEGDSKTFSSVGKTEPFEVTCRNMTYKLCKKMSSYKLKRIAA